MTIASPAVSPRQNTQRDRRPGLAAPEIKRTTEDVTAVSADGSFSGYASVFGIEDLSHDIVERGAFLASLAKRGADGVKMLYQHDPAEPIGKWTEIRETPKGLFVRGRLMTDLARGREVLAMMREGIVDGLSIGFRTIKGRTDTKSGIRRLTELDLWEISVVTFPMQPDARVTAVKSITGGVRLDRMTSADERRLALTLRRAAARLGADL